MQFYQINYNKSSLKHNIYIKPFKLKSTFGGCSSLYLKYLCTEINLLNFFQFLILTGFKSHPSSGTAEGKRYSSI